MIKTWIAKQMPRYIYMKLFLLLFAVCGFSNIAFSSTDESKPLIWDKSELPGPFYVPFYIGTIYPTPQSAVYYNEFIPMRQVTVVTGKGISTDDPRIDLLRARLAYTGGALYVADSMESAKPDSTIIALGDTGYGAEISPPEKEQGYVIMPMQKNGQHIIILKGFDEQGLLWAVTSLNQLTTVKDETPLIRKAEVKDYPIHKLRGFRGRSWHNNIWHPAQRLDNNDAPDQEEYETMLRKEDDDSKTDETDEEEYEHAESSKAKVRIRALDTEAHAWYVLNAKMNYVVLGAFHSPNRPNRGNWRNPQPPIFVEGIKRTGELLSPLGIKWFSGYNPCPRAKVAENRWGAGIDTGAEEDFQLIMRDARMLASAGGGLFLAFDDYRFGLLHEESRRFGTAREADVYFLNRLYNELSAEFQQAKILFCPPFYWGPTGGVAPSYGEGRTPYLKRLSDLPEDIDIFWTGPRVRATRIPEKNKEWVEWINELIGRKPVFWQNLSEYSSIPRYPPYYYVPDPVEWWEEAFYDGFYHDIKAYLPNAPMGMPDIAILSMTLSDYLWNPEAYDAERSVREATMMMMGPEAFPKIAALHDVMNYFNRYKVGGYELSKEKMTTAAANILEIRRMVALLEQRWDQAIKTAPEMGRWSAMHGFRRRPAGIIQTLESRYKPEYSSVVRVIDSTVETAIRETDINPETDILLHAYLFSGGTDDRAPQLPVGPMQETGPEIFSILSEQRPAVWLQNENESLEARFFLINPPEDSYELILLGQERDVDPPANIRILINEELLYEGESHLPRHDWAASSFKLPGSKLKIKDNTLKIENTHGTMDKPRFLLNYAVIMKSGYQPD